jgi:virginiamycin A acetyltransferase
VTTRPGGGLGGRGRLVVKRLVFVCSITAAFPVYLLYRLLTLVSDKETAIQGPSQLVSLVPGRPGNYLRTGFYALTLRRCSPDVTISFGTIFSTPDCSLGSHVYIGSYCVISDCDIADDVLIGSAVHVISGKNAHGFDDPDTPLRLQHSSRNPIRIGANSWIGNHATVMADVDTGCVVGAGSVVTRNLPENSVAAGNPARVLRTRGRGSAPGPARSPDPSS